MYALGPLGLEVGLSLGLDLGTGLVLGMENSVISMLVVFSMPVAGRLTAQLACRQYYRNGNVIGCFK